MVSGFGWDRKSCLISLILVAATLAVFAPVCRYGFIQYDDSINVCDNPYLSSPDLRSIIRFWSRPYANMYIPVTYSVWWCGANLSRAFTTRLDPRIFHAMNLVVHGLAVLVVFKILLQLVRRTYGSVGGARVETAAAFGALLFAVHPLQVQAVAWITGMKAELSGFLSLLALNWYVEFVAMASTVHGDDGSTEASGVKANHRYILATIVFVLAMLSKPSAVTLVPAVLIVDFGVFKRSIRKSIGSLIPWAALAVPIILLTKTAQPDRNIAFIPSLWERIVIAGDAIAFYMYKLFVPLRLGLDYGRSPRYIVGWGWAYLTFMVPCVIAGLLSASKSGRKWLVPFGIFVAGVLPVLGIVPAYFQNLSTVQDHFLYFSMLGPALAFAYLFMSGGRTAIAICVIVLIALAVCSIIQSNTWGNDSTVAERALEINPRSVVARLMLGNICAVRGGTERAILYYSEAVRHDPDSALAHYNLGVFLTGKGRTDEAMSHYREAVRIDPAYAEAYCAMGSLLAGTGDVSGALASYSRALDVASDFMLARKGMGLVLAQNGKMDEAILQFSEVLRREPGDAETQVKMGDVLFAQGRFDEAIAHYTDGLRSHPDNLHAMNNLGNSLLHRGRIDEAIACFSEALRIDPELAEAHSNLAFALTERGRLDEAILHYNKALSSKPDLETARRGLRRALDRKEGL